MAEFLLHTKLSLVAVSMISIIALVTGFGLGLLLLFERLNND